MKLQTIDEFQTSRLWLMPDGFGDDALVDGAPGQCISCDWYGGPGRHNVFATEGVFGVVLAIRWAAVEIAPRQFDWSGLDRNVARAAQRARPVTLLFNYRTYGRINRSWAPDYVRADHGRYGGTLGHGGEHPGDPTDPWNQGWCVQFNQPSVQAAWRGFIDAIAERYGNDSRVNGFVIHSESCWANWARNDPAMYRSIGGAVGEASIALDMARYARGVLINSPHKQVWIGLNYTSTDTDREIPRLARDATIADVGIWLPDIAAQPPLTGDTNVATLPLQRDAHLHLGQVAGKRLAGVIESVASWGVEPAHHATPARLTQLLSAVKRLGITDLIYRLSGGVEGAAWQSLVGLGRPTTEPKLK